MGSPTLFRAAVNEARAGNHKKSRIMLRQLLYDDPNHELAWLWLSKVSESREDKIDALEMALSINPLRKETAVLLQKLKQSSPPADADPLDKLYRQAAAAYKEGRSLQARLLLQEIVDKNREYAKAWFGLGQIGLQPEDRLFALTVGLYVDPANSKAQTQLTAMETDTSLNHFALAQRFEAFGLIDTAVTYYQKAQQHAFQAQIRQAAQVKQQQLQLEAKEINITTTPTLNLVRLTAGPIVLYLLLSLIVSGINPLNVTLPLLVGALTVGLGSFFIASAHQQPAHPIWQQFLGSDENPHITQQYLLTAIGVALLLLPFAIIFLTNANEFIAYYAIHPVNFSN